MATIQPEAVLGQTQAEGVAREIAAAREERQRANDRIAVACLIQLASEFNQRPLLGRVAFAIRKGEPRVSVFSVDGVGQGWSEKEEQDAFVAVHGVIIELLGAQSEAFDGPVGSEYSMPRSFVRESGAPVRAVEIARGWELGRLAPAIEAKEIEWALGPVDPAPAVARGPKMGL